MQNIKGAKQEIVTLGHIENLLVGEQVGANLGQMQSFKQYPGGFVTNLSVACSRLQLNTSIISHIGDDAIGKNALETLKNNGVDIEHITPQKQTQSISSQIAVGFDGSIQKQTQPASMSLALNEKDVFPQWISQSTALVISAQQFLTNQRAIRKAIVCAKEEKVSIFLAFDLPVNNNPSQETIDKFNEVLPGLLPLVDVVIGTQQEYLSLTAGVNLYASLTAIRNVTEAKLICILEQGASFWCEKTIPTDWQEAPNHAGFNLPIKNPIARVEGFIAGFLYAWKQQMSTEQALMHANAVYSITASRENGFQDLPSLKELKTYISAHNSEKTQLNAIEFNNLHHTTCRNKTENRATIIGFNFNNPDESLVGLVQESLRTTKNSHALQALYISSPHQAYSNHDEISAWKIKEEDLREQDISQTLLKWPTKEKVILEITTHPDENYATRTVQEKSILKAANSCRANQREFIVQIRLSSGQHVTSKSISQILERYYSIGIFPDWWQIQAPRDEKPYAHIERVIEQYDPHCLGVILQCAHIDVKQLNIALSFAKGTSWCKGFVLEQKCFAAIIEQWKNNEIENHNLSEMITAFYSEAAQHWSNCFSKNEATAEEETSIA
jgi:5-dehydro-2-deoxygluconokinase